MSHLEDLKLVLAETLERRGVMSAIRSQLRAEVFNALDDKSATKPKPANETILVNELILEYLKYNNYHYAAMILKAEAGQTDTSFSREFMEAELSIQTPRPELPLLYHLIQKTDETSKD